MQHDNNIEDKLRQMEAVEQPDLSQMDKHWQQMQGILQPGSLPVKKGWPKWMLNTLPAAAIAVLIGAVFFYVSSKKDINNPPVAVQQETSLKENNIKATAPVIRQDSAVGEPAVEVVQSRNPYLIFPGEETDTAATSKWTEEDSILATVRLNYTACATCPAKEEGVLSSAERKARLVNLFTQLEKQEQHFIIDNSRDTLLQFKEGTVLMIPAKTFGGMNGVELTAKEFYKTSEIVLNQLHTASNKEQLETGGMINLAASYHNMQLSFDVRKPLILFMADTSDKMKDMQLFNGNHYSPGSKFASSVVIKDPQKEMDQSDTASGKPSYLNWIMQGRYFTKNIVQTEVKVLNLVNEPYYVKETSKGKTGYFMIGEESTLERSKLKKMLKEKYGYYKVKLRSDFRNHFISIKFPGKFGYTDRGDTKFNYTAFNRSIGDSVWMDKATADKYNLAANATRQVLLQNRNNNPMFGNITVQFDEKGNRVKQGNDSTRDRYEDFALQSVKVFDDIENKYGVRITELGWINCDRFYSDKRKKVEFRVDLGDTAANYYSMLVFDKINSMMAGYAYGNETVFENVPVGEPVKIISIGINKKGETVYSVTHTTTSGEELRGLQFQATSVPDLRTALSKYDK